MGAERPYSEYTEIVGLNFDTLQATRQDWCYRGDWPDGVSMRLLALFLSCGHGYGYGYGYGYSYGLGYG
jgi:hypothetical protein